MKLAIVGSRMYNDYHRMEKSIKDFTDISKITRIISGGARGADTLADNFAQVHDIPIIIFYPNWKKYGKLAGLIRNEKIVQECDKLLAFWNGTSTGTKHSIELADKYEKEYKIFYF